MVLFKIAFHLKMHQNEFFQIFFFFIFDISTSKSSKSIEKNINLKPFQAKNTLRKHSKAEAPPNTYTILTTTPNFLSMQR
jgi:hypothetical protein